MSLDLDPADTVDLDAAEWRLIPNEPLDDTHAESLAAIAAIRREHAECSYWASRWAPAPIAGAERTGKGEQ